MQADGVEPIVILGAGITGLSCARALAERGLRAVILDRARGVGGRCATRRIGPDGGQAVDFGVSFLHGRNPDFLASIAEVEATRLDGWPNEIHGVGHPCQPQAFSPLEARIAFAEGISVFPKHLARGLEVRPDTRVVSASLERDAIELTIEGTAPVRARTVALALATEQTSKLLESLGAKLRELDAARALLGIVRSQPALTMIAAYAESVPRPPWHITYPEESRIIQLIAHDSSKREDPRLTVFVIQAHARWSREHIDDPGWANTLLAEATRLLGPWAATPTLTQEHRWRFARVDMGTELTGPLLIHLPGGARLGLAGELFAPGGGVEAAWLSGRELARRISEE